MLIDSGRNENLVNGSVGSSDEKTIEKILLNSAQEQIRVGDQLEQAKIFESNSQIKFDTVGNEITTSNASQDINGWENNISKNPPESDFNAISIQVNNVGVPKFVGNLSNNAGTLSNNHGTLSNTQKIQG